MTSAVVARMGDDDAARGKASSSRGRPRGRGDDDENEGDESEARDRPVEVFAAPTLQESIVVLVALILGLFKAVKTRCEC